jgi:hypothetical protein
VSAVTRRAAVLHPDVARLFERLDEGDVPAVGRQLRPGDFGIAEEQLAIEHGRLGRCRRGRLRCRGRGLGEEGRRAGERQERAEHETKTAEHSTSLLDG